MRQKSSGLRKAGRILPYVGLGSAYLASSTAPVYSLPVESRSPKTPEVGTAIAEEVIVAAWAVAVVYVAYNVGEMAYEVATDVGDAVSREMENLSMAYCPTCC